MYVNIILESLVVISVISQNLNGCGEGTGWDDILAQNEVFTSWDAFDGDIVGELSWVRPLSQAKEDVHGAA